MSLLTGPIASAVCTQNIHSCVTRLAFSARRDSRHIGGSRASRTWKAMTQCDEGEGLIALPGPACWTDSRKGGLRLAVVVYRRHMPGRKRPTDEDAATARRVLLDGLARDADIFEVLSELAPQHPRNDTFPGEVFLHLAADALEWCGASRAEPLPLERLRERFLPECAFRGRQNAKLQYAVLTAAVIHGGTEPDLLEEIADWRTDDLWQYAMYAATAYIRAAASRAGVPVRQVCQDLNERPGYRVR
jgi:hypothetical protein